MRWSTNTTTMRERSRRASPQPEKKLAVGRRGLGPREQEEQRTQRASFVATYHKRVHESTHRAAAGLGCFVEKNTT